jgi:hypothetical protein
MFVLTPGEQRLVIFVVLAFVIGAWVRHHREMNLNETTTPGVEWSTSPLISPTPNER